VVLILISILAAVGMILAAALFIFLKNRSERLYDPEARRAYLSKMRSAYEQEISDINLRLTATPERWADANHLLIDAQNTPIYPGVEAIGPHNFLRGIGIPQTHVKIDPKLIFVLTPFRKEEEKDFRVVKQICSETGFKCVRGDEDHISGEILPHIVRLILESRIVIANITSRNPNVFYELGLAQALGKSCIIISKSDVELPFDMQSKRIVLYENESDLRNRLTKAIIRTLA
jgi:hypothetical protein